MLRAILIIILIITFGIPILSKVKEYWDDKKGHLKIIEDTAKKAIRYSGGSNKK